MKAWILVVAELSGPVREKIPEVQRWADTRRPAATPPHATMAGSSGVGPLPLGTSVELLLEKIEPITRETAPIVMKFERPHRFIQSHIIVLPLDPHGPLLVLHERMAGAGLPFERARFQFSPHATLSFYSRVSAENLKRLLALRFDNEVGIHAVRSQSERHRSFCLLSRDADGLHRLESSPERKRRCVLPSP